MKLELLSITGIRFIVIYEHLTYVLIKPSVICDRVWVVIAQEHYVNLYIVWGTNAVVFIYHGCVLGA